MFFKTQPECVSLLTSLGFSADELGDRLMEPVAGRSMTVYDLNRSAARHTMAISSAIASWLTDLPLCVLWLTEWGVWPSSENLHLYYRLRASYCDGRELLEAPGHLFRSYEKAEVVTFLSLVIQFGWEGHFVYAPGWPRVFLSHDGWMRIWPGEASGEIRQDLERLALDYESDGDDPQPSAE